MTIEKSTISGNSGSLAGGVFHIGDDSTISDSTISDNSTAGNYGVGGLLHVGTLTVTNTTISGNTGGGGIGGAVNSSGPSGFLTLTNSTITRTSGAYAGGAQNAGVLNLNRTLISGNTSSSVPEVTNDASSSVTANNFNVFGFSGNTGVSGFSPGANDIVPTVPLAQVLNTTLANNGGPTRTHALVSGSPAVDAVGSGCPPPSSDQRGTQRPQGAQCDVGAFELEGGGGGTPPPPPPDGRCAGRVVTLMGTQLRDDLRGTSGPDVIQGLGGNDRISGLGGNDTICGGLGNDDMLGGPGNDRLFGDGGNDRLIGGDGRDRLDGGAGRDQCDGGPPRQGDTARNCEQVTNVP